MRILTSGSLVVALVSAISVASSSWAVDYEVDRSFSNGPSSATLTGIVSVPLGNYVIQNAAPNPFTSVNLTLTVNATPYHLTYALTNVITGTGQFTVDATPTTLTFTASGDAGNPADLVFSDNTNPFAENRYAIGSNGVPAFQVAATGAGFVLGAAGFPDLFGIAIPEPSSIVLVSVAILGLGLRRRRSALG